MTQLDTIGIEVSARLNIWGSEFALHRDYEYLGHRSKDMIQILIEHKGEMPARAVGFKPMEILPEALLIEDIIAEMARSDLTLATVMRAYYCGRGRRLHERFDQCNELLSGYRRHGLDTPPVKRESYRVMHLRGFDWVRGVWLGMARAA